MVRLDSLILELSKKITDRIKCTELGNELKFDSTVTEGAITYALNSGEPMSTAAHKLMSKKKQNMKSENDIRNKLEKAFQEIEMSGAFDEVERKLKEKEAKEQAQRSASNAPQSRHGESADGPGAAAAGDAEVDKVVPTTSRTTSGIDRGDWKVPAVPKKEQYPISDYKDLGMAVVINNETFEIASDDRVGTEEDAKRVTKVLDTIGFDLKYTTKNEPPLFGAEKQASNENPSEEKSSVLKDLKMDDLEKALYDVSQMDHSQYACFCCVVLTHGSEGYIKAVDGPSMSIKRLTDHFKPLSCPTLRDKPKLFFIEACQGTLEDKGSEQPDDAGKEPELLPLESDIFVFYAAPFGYTAYRHTKYGSRFIQCLCKALENHYHNRELVELATAVNKMVSQITGDRKTKQTPMMTSTLRKQFFFKEQ